jgi:transcriptional regulator with XRE-family HTH domain
MTRREPLFNQAHRTEITRRLKNFRAKHLFGQKELADELQISRNSISNYERGVSLPRLRILRRFIELERKLIGEGWVREEKGI